MSSYPIKAIYDPAGTTVTGLGEFGPGDTIALDALPTGTTSNDVALGDHHHNTVYSKKPASATIAEHVALFADTSGGLKQADVAFSALVRGPGYAINQTTNALAVFTGEGNTIKKTELSGPGLLKVDASGVASVAASGTDYQGVIGVSGLLKGTGSGSVSAATKGTDYVEPGTATSFTKPQRPSFHAASLIPSSANYSWDLSTYQILHLTITSGVAATLSVSSLTDALVGLSYRLIVSGAASSLALPSAIKWASDTPPTLTKLTTKADIFTFEVMTLSGSLALVEVGRNTNVG